MLNGAERFPTLWLEECPWCRTRFGGQPNRQGRRKAHCPVCRLTFIQTHQRDRMDCLVFPDR